MLDRTQQLIKMLRTCCALFNGLQRKGSEPTQRSGRQGGQGDTLATNPGGQGLHHWERSPSAPAPALRLLSCWPLSPLVLGGSLLPLRSLSRIRLSLLSWDLLLQKCLLGPLPPSWMRLTGGARNWNTT